MDETPEELGLDPSLEDLDYMQVITIIRTPHSFRVETSGMTTDAVLACLARATTYQCMSEWEDLSEMDLDEDDPEGGLDA